MERFWELVQLKGGEPCELLNSSHSVLTRVPRQRQHAFYKVYAAAFLSFHREVSSQLAARNDMVFKFLQSTRWLNDPYLGFGIGLQRLGKRHPFFNYYVCHNKAVPVQPSLSQLIHTESLKCWSGSLHCCVLTPEAYCCEIYDAMQLAMLQRYAVTNATSAPWNEGMRRCVHAVLLMLKDFCECLIQLKDSEEMLFSPLTCAIECHWP